MKIGRKLTYAKQHVESILRHDDEPLAARRAAAEALRAHLDAELKIAEEREAAKVKSALEDKAQ